MEGEMERLPEGCIANVISFTTPLDACRFSVVSKIFKSAAESDAVWERFLPPDYQSIISNSAPSSSSSSPSASSLRFLSKKELFFSLCHNPILIDGGKKSFSLDKLSGKKCYMISARDLTIVWGDTPAHWQWTSILESRFTEVAQLVHVWWLEIRGRIDTRSLSTGTLYTAYLVFKLIPRFYGFGYQPIEGSVGLVGGKVHKQNVYLYAQLERRICFPISRRITYHHSRSLEWQASTPRKNDGHYPKQRGDDWMEIELGDFLNERDEEAELEISLLDTSAHLKSGLIVQGIELRPKHGT